MTAAAPSAVTLRAYQVGFGDCLLLSVTYDQAFGTPSRRQRHMLIDFGSNHKPNRGPAMTDIATLIATHTGGHLDVLVATHRHKDHISAFGDPATAPAIAALAPDLVVRPWTDDPLAPADAAGPHRLDDGSRQFAMDLRSTHDLAAQIQQRFTDDRSAGNRRLAALAATQVPNQDALDNLVAWGGKTTIAYVTAGDQLSLGALMPGVSATVLGPPTLDQAGALDSQARSSPQYWLGPAGATAFTDLAAKPDADAMRHALDRLAGPDGLGAARWLLDRLDPQQTDQLLSIVRNFDEALNNTSVVLLVAVGQQHLLLSGDAQLENWSHTLTLIDQPEHKDLRASLANVGLYKVGHHGSRNATPKSLYKLWMTERTAPRRPEFVMSTMAGVYGSTTLTKVPRTTLVAALQACGDLHSTATLGTLPCIELTAPTDGSAGFSTPP